VKSLHAEVEELLPLIGIGEFEINGRVSIFPVTHIGGKDGQSRLRVLAPATYTLESVDRERMP
jgi:hypothetical protein